MSLYQMPNELLLSKIKDLVSREREVLVDILRHLREIDSRRLYLEIGFPSLWAYCTKELGYSEASAQRRIEAMRAIREIPILEKKIENGTLSLVNVASAQSAFRKCKVEIEKKLDVFESLEGQSQSEGTFILAANFPQLSDLRETVRPLSGDAIEIKVVLSPQQFEKLKQAKDLLSHGSKSQALAGVIEAMADLVIAKKDLGQQSEKRELRVQKSALPPLRRSRYISPKVKRAVWRYAESSCEFIDKKSGRRCSGRHRLEIEHVVPIAYGGTSEAANLKLFCRAHNVFSAQQANLI